MSGKAGLIAAGIAATIALGTGGYFANEWRVCSGLQASYLEETSAIVTNLKTRAAVTAPVVTDLIDQSNAAAIERANRLYVRLDRRCGSGASAAAQREAEKIMAMQGADDAL